LQQVVNATTGAPAKMMVTDGKASAIRLEESRGDTMRPSPIDCRRYSDPRRDAASCGSTLLGVETRLLPGRSDSLLMRVKLSAASSASCAADRSCRARDSSALATISGKMSFTTRWLASSACAARRL
jgi:hypothetical protein